MLAAMLEGITFAGEGDAHAYMHEVVTRPPHGRATTAPSTWCFRLMTSNLTVTSAGEIIEITATPEREDP